MEFVLKNTDIFDEGIDEKLSKAIEASLDNFNKEHTYKLTISFHVDLLNDPRFEEFIVPVPSKTSKGTKKDKIYEVMSYQLKKIENVLEEKGICFYSTTIQGDILQVINSIKIDINEDISEPISIDKGNKKKKMDKVSSIIPSLPYTRQTVTNLASERISELYYKIMSIIKNKKIMSEILEIEETEDDSKLFRAFANQYGALWLTTSQREKELLDQLKERSIFVLNKYIDEKDNGGK